MEATKFTEVGFHGRDVDQIIRDLMDNAVTMVRQRQRHTRKAEIEAAVERRILDALYGASAEARTRVSPLTTPGPSLLLQSAFCTRGLACLLLDTGCE